MTLQLVHSQMTDKEAVDKLIDTTVRMLPSPHTRRVYSSWLRKFLAECRGQPFNRLTVESYLSKRWQQGDSVSVLNQSIAAIKRFAEVCSQLQLITQEQATAIKSLKTRAAKGFRSGNWLTKEQAEVFLREGLSGADRSPKDRRDGAVMALLLGCGLRRAEASMLTWEQIQKREGRDVLVDVRGKGGRLRTIVIPRWATVMLLDWMAISHTPGIVGQLVLRSIRENGTINGHLSESGIWLIVKERAEKLGLGSIRPHDLRRTFARLSRKGGSPIEQIQMALGHSSVQTTERYLNTMLDFERPAGDYMGLLSGEDK